MSSPAHVLLDLVTAPQRRRKPRLAVRLANTPEDVLAIQELRYRVFVEEMGARLRCNRPGIESDEFDPYCRHLMVVNQESGEVVGCYRILVDNQAIPAGGYYSQKEFDLTRVLAIPGRFMEVGRTCVHPDYRDGATIALLWNGLARFMVMNKFDYLMGCASIPLGNDPVQAVALYRDLSKRYLAPSEWRTFPKTPLPNHNESDNTIDGMAVPPLIKAYLRVGAKICGEPAWDPSFNVADLFLLLRADNISRRYVQHFVDRA